MQPLSAAERGDEVIFVVGADITTGVAFGTSGLDPLPGSAALPAAGERHVAFG